MYHRPKNYIKMKVYKAILLYGNEILVSMQKKIVRIQAAELRFFDSLEIRNARLDRISNEDTKSELNSCRIE